MKKTHSKINRILKDILPGILYSNAYLLYQKVFNRNNAVDISRLKKNASFTKSGFFDFTLEDTTFKIFLNPNNGVVDYEIFANGVFEDGVLKLIKSELRKSDIFLDVGANIGQHSIYASFFCKHVYAFEPIQRIFDQCNKSIFENNIFNISTYNYALGEKSESIPIWSSESNMGASSLMFSNNRKIEQYVKVEKLDSIYEKIGIEKIDFIKIDVEGYEWNVLQGLRGVIKNNKPKILLEFAWAHQKNSRDIPQNIYDFLIENNYHIYNIGSDGYTKVKVNSIDEIIDLEHTNLFCI